MTINTSGGGAQTNINGLKFEQDTSLLDTFKNSNRFFIKTNIKSSSKKYYQHFIRNKYDENLGELGSKYELYRNILNPKKINYKDIISRRLLPDDYFHNYIDNTIYIIEKKFQSKDGSTDEKLQTCDFKLQQYKKLFTPLKINVEYIFVLNDWFKKPKYADVLEYIHSMDCHYYFNELPLTALNLK